MRYLMLVLKGVRRNTRRSLLTVLSVAIAVFLFSSLRAILDGFSGAVAASSSTRVVTVRSTSLMFTMPITHFESIKAVSGVRDATWANWFGGVYKDPSNFFAQFAVDPESYLRVYPRDPADAGRAIRVPLRSDGSRRRRGPGAAVWVQGRRSRHAQGGHSDLRP